MSGTSRGLPRIGITAWRRPLPTPLGERTDLFTLASEYVESVRSAGGLPLILPHSSPPEAVLDIIDGLLMSGGGDIHPLTYGAEDQGTSHEVNAEADRWEIELVQAASARRMPVFGICRGMQIMAVAFGGRLQQEIADSPGHPDMDGLGANVILRSRHRVELAPGSTCATLYGAMSRSVNTIHHQAVVDAGIFAVAARGDGGYIEAIEAGEAWPALGVQWHPEKMQEPAEMRTEQALFRYFIGRAAAYAAQTSHEAWST